MRLFLAAVLSLIPVAEAGSTVVNLELYARWCVETDSVPTFELRAHKGTTTQHATLDGASFRSLVAAADYDEKDWQTSCAPLDSLASSMLGSWYTAFTTDDREQFCFWMDELG